ncbi:hypothetical protein GCM10011534_22070 [Pseudooceanicola nanhaiensis]|jgi:2-aminoethylphosphonate-pyruvate transaminase|uniref:MobA-like NTP transferase domain-containing protein n=1 Tax=Pseudooceanicola nanhaiensis TaxID=375761 RepID=A0A917SVM2_9RHOB|nr:phosphocholine cytidylyltransferase family protein [Pseudooceanicola nanhaiensis]GGL99806.1 hypothetical protein GCM10011534_22070 [Pseudooceanicola nanhaiensis]
MGEFTALIVAAGLGVRMGARGRLTPKGLIALDGLPLVRASVMHLAARGVERVRIVTGHLSELYQQEFSATPGVELIHNPDYATTGSLRSMMTGLAGLDGPLLVLESDIMYEPRALDPLIAAGSGMVLSGPTGAGDEVYVWTDAAGNLVDMSKQADHRSDAPRGELVGITAFTAAHVAAFRGTAEALLADRPKLDYEAGVVAFAQDTDFHCPLIPDLAWAEVDDEQMLAHAREHVWPRASAGLVEAARRKAI